MTKRLPYLIALTAALILEILPYGAVCNFANPEGEPWRETFSYFDPLPFGYANFSPLLTAVTTFIALLLVLAFCLTGNRRIAKASLIATALGALLSLCPLLYGIRFFSLVGALISLSLMVEAFLLYRLGKRL